MQIHRCIQRQKIPIIGISFGNPYLLRSSLSWAHILLLIGTCLVYSRPPHMLWLGKQTSREVFLLRCPPLRAGNGIQL